MSMIISVKDALRNEGERYDLAFTADLPATDYMGPITFLNTKVEGAYFADGGNIRCYGKIFVTCRFACDRCLKEFDRDFTFSFSEIFSSNAEEENYRLSRSETFDFQPLLNDTVLSGLPIERLCREDCKGLCPHCGIDKNFSSCSCEDDVKEDNPFAVLNGLGN